MAPRLKSFFPGENWSKILAAFRDRGVLREDEWLAALINVSAKEKEKLRFAFIILNFFPKRSGKPGSIYREWPFFGFPVSALRILRNEWPIPPYRLTFASLR
jgi:hypothetical protein